jgi:hypothetical protein
MEGDMRILKLLVLFLFAGVFLAPITSEAKTPKSVSVQTQSGKTVKLRTMMTGGKMMILVPMDMACDVFHGMAKYC